MTNTIYSGIYIFTNKINGKQYVGQSINLKGRLLKHLQKGNKSAIQSAINKYGKENFHLKLFEIPIDLLNTYEKLTIIALNSLSPNGYNLHSGGNNHTVSTETRIKQSKAQLNNRNGSGKRTEKSCNNISASLIGRQLSNEHKQKICKKLKGRKRSEETKLKISLSKLNKPIPKLKKKQQSSKCPHCDKEGGISLMTRYHFNNCKYK